MNSYLREDVDFFSWFGVLAKIAVIICCAFVGNTAYADATAANAESPTLQQQRELYARAKTRLAKGDTNGFEKLRAQLTEYPLYPYLVYAAVASRPGDTTTEDISTILQQYDDLAFAPRLRSHWLETLAAQKKWAEFVSLFSPTINSTQLRCYHALALHQLGHKEEAIKQGIALWQAGKSQPKQCDAIFSILIDNKRISSEIAWVRFSQSLFNHEYGLANYVLKFIADPALKARAEHYLRVDRDPGQIANYREFQTDSKEEREIILHGITHLARIDATTTLKHWNRYNQTHAFSDEQQGKVVSALVKSLYQQNQVSAADNYLLQSKSQVANDVLEWRLRELIKNADWQAVISWHQKLGARVADDDRWNYWYARSLELSGQPDSEITDNIYRAISKERSFYGFLASEWLKSPYDMNHQPVEVTQKDIDSLSQTRTFQRIKELYHQDELTWARREWQMALSGKPQHSWLTAAKLAEQWQWHNQAIMTMIQTGYWDDIDVRFPQAHKAAFLSEAAATDIPPNLLLALSRQESAFNDKVTSPAGAKGLMQLMPATAKETARKNNIRYSSSSELFDPNKNILIGSRYYKQMLDKFNNNRILATAAYNAGPARVYRWQRESQGTLPFDAWIEIIPFRETRNYVQNVLAFSIIYAHHMGLDVDILSPDEKNTLL